MLKVLPPIPPKVAPSFATLPPVPPPKTPRRILKKIKKEIAQEGGLSLTSDEEEYSDDGGVRLPLIISKDGTDPKAPIVIDEDASDGNIKEKKKKRDKGKEERRKEKRERRRRRKEEKQRERTTVYDEVGGSQEVPICVTTEVGDRQEERICVESATQAASRSDNFSETKPARKARTPPSTDKPSKTRDRSTTPAKAAEKPRRSKTPIIPPAVPRVTAIIIPPSPPKTQAASEDESQASDSDEKTDSRENLQLPSIFGGECWLCGKAFATIQDLHIHERKHKKREDSQESYTAKDDGKDLNKRSNAQKMQIAGVVVPATPSSGGKSASPDGSETDESDAEENENKEKNNAEEEGSDEEETESHNKAGKETRDKGVQTPEKEWPKENIFESANSLKIRQIEKVRREKKQKELELRRQMEEKEQKGDNEEQEGEGESEENVEDEEEVEEKSSGDETLLMEVDQEKSGEAHEGKEQEKSREETEVDNPPEIDKVNSSDTNNNESDNGEDTNGEICSAEDKDGNSAERVDTAMKLTETQQEGSSDANNDGEASKSDDGSDKDTGSWKDSREGQDMTLENENADSEEADGSNNNGEESEGGSGDENNDGKDNMKESGEENDDEDEEEEEEHEEKPQENAKEAVASKDAQKPQLQRELETERDLKKAQERAQALAEEVRSDQKLAERREKEAKARRDARKARKIEQQEAARKKREARKTEKEKSQNAEDKSDEDENEEEENEDDRQVEAQIRRDLATVQNSDSDEGEFPCDMCERRYHRKASAQRHMKEAHNAIYSHGYNSPGNVYNYPKTPKQSSRSPSVLSPTEQALWRKLGYRFDEKTGRKLVAFDTPSPEKVPAPDVASQNDSQKSAAEESYPSPKSSEYGGDSARSKRQRDDASPSLADSGSNSDCVLIQVRKIGAPASGKSTPKPPVFTRTNSGMSAGAISNGISGEYSVKPSDGPPRFSYSNIPPGGSQTVMDKRPLYSETHKCASQPDPDITPMTTPTKKRKYRIVALPPIMNSGDLYADVVRAMDTGFYCTDTMKRDLLNHIKENAEWYHDTMIYEARERKKRRVWSSITSKTKGKGKGKGVLGTVQRGEFEEKIKKLEEEKENLQKENKRWKGLTAGLLQNISEFQKED